MNDLRPVAWSVTDASGWMSLHREEALANHYAGHVRGAIIHPLVRLEDAERALLDDDGTVTSEKDQA